MVKSNHKKGVIFMKKWRQVAVVMLCLMAALTMTMTADAKTKKKQPSGKVCSGVKWT